MMLNQDEKAQGLKHIHYEAEMALLMAKALHVFWTRDKEGNLGWVSDLAIHQAIRGGLLESLCTHTRNLILFLRENKKKYKIYFDIHSEDYEYKPIKLSTNEEDILNRLHRHVSHISKDRLDKPQDWNFNNDFKPVFKKIADFFSYLLNNQQALFMENSVNLKVKDFEALKDVLASDDPLISNYKQRHEGRQTIHFYR